MAIKKPIVFNFLAVAQSNCRLFLGVFMQPQLFEYNERSQNPWRESACLRHFFEKKLKDVAIC